MRKKFAIPFTYLFTLSSSLSPVVSSSLELKRFLLLGTFFCLCTTLALRFGLTLHLDNGLLEGTRSSLSVSLLYASLELDSEFQRLKKNASINSQFPVLLECISEYLQFVLLFALFARITLYRQPLGFFSRPAGSSDTVYFGVFLPALYNKYKWVFLRTESTTRVMARSTTATYLFKFGRRSSSGFIMLTAFLWRTTFRWFGFVGPRFRRCWAGIGRLWSGIAIERRKD